MTKKILTIAILSFLFAPFEGSFAAVESYSIRVVLPEQILSSGGFATIMNKNNSQVADILTSCGASMQSEAGPVLFECSGQNGENHFFYLTGTFTSPSSNKRLSGKLFLRKGQNGELGFVKEMACNGVASPFIQIVCQ